MDTDMRYALLATLALVALWYFGIVPLWVCAIPVAIYYCAILFIWSVIITVLVVMCVVFGFVRPSRSEH